jgi:hypothetical protein
LREKAGAAREFANADSAQQDRSLSHACCAADGARKDQRSETKSDAEPSEGIPDALIKDPLAPT